MDIKRFNTLVDNPLELTFQDKVLVQEECLKTPYCAMLRLMDTLCSKACNIAADKMCNMHTTLMYLPVQNNLASLMERVKLRTPAATTATPVMTPVAEPTPVTNQKPTPAQESDILKEINDYQEISFKTAPKSVILDKFLETAAYHESGTSPIDPVAISESGKKSLQPNDALNTETMALILERQGKLEKAVEVYMNLSIQNPEKNATFAARIEEIKKKIENN